MAGRLEQYDDFVEKSQYNVEQKKPKKKVNQKDNLKKLKANNINLVFKSSKENKLICYIFYSKQGKKVYRMVVIPKKSLIKRSKLYIEVIDVKSLTRKLFRRDRIVKAQLTEKKFDVNQSSITYKK